jgi:serine/threonine protein kinase
MSEADDRTRKRSDGDAAPLTPLRAEPGAADATQRRAAPDDRTLRRAGESTAALDPLAGLGADETRARAASGARGPAQHAAGGAVEAGTVIRRRYVLERLIGSGGMGQVWQARDLRREQARDPNPHVAIKLLNDDFEADPDGFVSLQRESTKAQELAHPNVSTVYDFDIDDGGSGRAFMSMELLQGSTLDAVIRAHPDGMPRAEASPLIAGMARGLKYAHEKGLVHSDFKPGNVFVTGPGAPKILDFGIARAANIAGIERRQDSFDAGSLGGLTPAYAAAQMIERADPHPADDVYALGLVAYELLTGRHPFQRRPATEARDGGMAPPRIRSIRRHEWQAIARALEFDRGKRWQDAGEFLRAYEGKSVAAMVLGGLAAVLALAAGAFWYQAHTASLPDVPFESLPADVQAEFRSHMANAQGEWRLVEQGNGDESLNAASEFGKAYALHPKNPEATAGLEKSADYVIQRLQRVSDRAERLQQLKSFEGLSDFYAGYKPLVAAIEAAGGK